jgi:hypothetical protein
MAPRKREWGEEVARVQMLWPKSLWKAIQRLALEEDTTATALMMEAAQLLLDSRRKEARRKNTTKP